MNEVIDVINTPGSFYFYACGYAITDFADPDNSRQAVWFKMDVYGEVSFLEIFGAERRGARAEARAMHFDEKKGEIVMLIQTS